LSLNCIGVFFECLPDDPALCKDPEILKINKIRLRFYERYGARPVINTRYETPLKPGGDCPPYLVFDPLGRDLRLSRTDARKIVRAILERTYGEVCPKDYVEMIVQSIQDDPVQIREPRYIKKAAKPVPRLHGWTNQAIALVAGRLQEIPHARERGYVESPVSISSILHEIEPTGLFARIPPARFSEKYIKAVHDPHFVDFLKQVCGQVEPGKSVYPFVFPLHKEPRHSVDWLVRAGCYCVDAFTPLNPAAYEAARQAVDSALTAAESLLKGYRLAYALVRPPGHHAQRRVFGGFCYFNSAAIAAQFLSAQGRVAVLDVDYHHGGGAQDIFYDRADVLTVSIHGHPSFAYPYFSGFTDELGEGEGRHYNMNLPLPESVDGKAYAEALRKALRKIKAFDPAYLVVAFGLDTAKDDPTGKWALIPADFEYNGKQIASLRKPVLVVQEGGYKTKMLGVNARHFFLGLLTGE